MTMTEEWQEDWLLDQEENERVLFDEGLRGVYRMGYLRGSQAGYADGYEAGCKDGFARRDSLEYVP